MSDTEPRTCAIESHPPTSHPPTSHPREHTAPTDNGPTNAAVTGAADGDGGDGRVRWQREDPGEHRDRAADARDEAAARADRAAAANDVHAQRLDAATIDAGTWRTRSEQARRAAGSDRARAADDRAAARADRAAAAADRRRSAIDDLTGAYRREAGMIELGRDVERAARTGHGLIIGFLDVDGLKTINDERGHTAGDTILRAVADAVRTHLRRGDVLVRCGGDEFVFSVLGLTEADVYERLDAIDAALHESRASVSWGLAAVTLSSVTPTSVTPTSVPLTSALAEAIEKADRDLYRRRRAARSSTPPERTRSPHSAPQAHGTAAPVESDHHRARGLLHLADTAPTRDDAATRDGLGVDGMHEATREDDIDAILADVQSVRPLFQPIVDLTDGTVIGYEALARWPGHPVTDPAAVFTAAAARGVLSELDQACRTAALDIADGAGMDRNHTLFLNLEPGAVTDLTDHARARLRRAATHIDIVVELTERSLLSDPAHLLTLVDQARSDGCRIALDDVGCHPDTLVLLDFIAPDIIKLDRALVQHDPAPQHTRLIAAIIAHTEATGAMILAEGIELDAHLDRGRAYGAVLGQGWKFGRAAELPARLPRADRPARTPTVGVGARAPRIASASSAAGRIPALPSDVFDYALPSIGRKPLVAGLTRQIEEHAGHSRESLTILSTFQSADFFTPAVAGRYARFAADNPFVAALGVGMADEPAPGVRGTDLDAAEPLTRHWVITVTGQHYFAAVIARDLGDTGGDADRRFEFLCTHDRSIVVAVARSLMQRVVPTPRT